MCRMALHETIIAESKKENNLLFLRVSLHVFVQSIQIKEPKR
jgi:hypothetical protein